MPLSDHEQRILEDIERRLQQEDPRLADHVARASLSSHLTRRIRWGTVGFIAGFVMLMLFSVSVWIAIAGFGVMLASGLLVYHQLRRMSGEQVRATIAERRLPGLLARWSRRFRRDEPEPPAT